MSSASGVPTTPVPAGYSAAQTRTIAAAVGLFARHGVSGTSLQMIANAIGVTKAAVYHQFKSKDDIVLAVARIELARLAAAADAAEAAGGESPSAAREALLTQMVDLAVERRHWVGALQTDPVMIRFLADHEPFQRLMDHLFSVLAGADADADARVPAAMSWAAIGGATLHPFVVDLDDEALRRHLMPLARRLFQLPD